MAFVGAVGATGNKIEITALGDAMNVGARLASEAKQGEALISEVTLETAGADSKNLDRREFGRPAPREPGLYRGDDQRSPEGDFCEEGL